MTSAFLLYLVIIKPFEHILQNIIAIGNECIVIVCAFLLIEVLHTGRMKHGIILIVLFTISIIATFTLSVIFQIFKMILMLKNKTPNIEEDDDLAPPPLTASPTRKLETEQQLENNREEDEGEYDEQEEDIPRESTSQIISPAPMMGSQSIESDNVDEESKWLDLVPRMPHKSYIVVDRLHM